MTKFKSALFLLALLTVFSCKKEDTNSVGSGGSGGGSGDMLLQYEADGVLNKFTDIKVILMRDEYDCSGQGDKVHKDFLLLSHFKSNGDNIAFQLETEALNPLGNYSNLPKIPCNTGDYGFVLFSETLSGKFYSSLNLRDLPTFSCQVNAFSGTEIDLEFSGVIYDWDVSSTPAVITDSIVITKGVLQLDKNYINDVR